MASVMNKFSVAAKDSGYHKKCKKDQILLVIGLNHRDWRGSNSNPFRFCDEGIMGEVVFGSP